MYTRTPPFALSPHSSNGEHIYLWFIGIDFEFGGSVCVKCGCLLASISIILNEFRYSWAILIHSHSTCTVNRNRIHHTCALCVHSEFDFCYFLITGHTKIASQNEKKNYGTTYVGSLETNKNELFHAVLTVFGAFVPKCREFSTFYNFAKVWYKWIYRPCNRISFGNIGIARRKKAASERTFEWLLCMNAMRAPFYFMTYFDSMACINNE